MDPVDFPESNHNLLPPKGMVNCGTLPTCRVVDTDIPFYISCWKPSQKDLEALARGEPVWLWVFGDGHPPVSVTTELPFKRG